MEVVVAITGVLEVLILGFMVALSVWSISIMIAKKRLLQKEFVQSDFETVVQKIKSGEQITSTKEKAGFFYGAAEAMMVSTAAAKNADVLMAQVDRSVSHFLKDKRSELNKDLYILASLGSNAPFIGLFGTVLGIIRAFAYLGSQSGSTAVMTGVSQALYATAVGLLVAIPAVTAYNYYSNRIKKAVSQVESLRDLFISQALKRI
jgi:biopolymer transport protein TolQ